MRLCVFGGQDTGEDFEVEEDEETWVEIEPLELYVQTDLVLGATGVYSVIKTSGQVQVNRNIDELRA